MRLPSQFNTNDNGELHRVGTSPYLKLIYSKVKSTALSMITGFQSMKDKDETGCSASTGGRQRDSGKMKELSVLSAGATPCCTGLTLQTCAKLNKLLQHKV